MFRTKVVEKIKTHILYSITFFFFRKSCLLCDNVEKCDGTRQATEENIIQRMPFSCWITEATAIRSEYVILITLPLQQWLRELPLMFRYTYIACLFFFQKPIRLLGHYTNVYCRPLEFN